MKIKIAIFFLSILLIAMLSTIISIFIIRTDKQKEKEYEESHVYIDTVVIDKYYTEGYCWFYGCAPTTYTIVSKQYLSNGQEITWTNNVNQMVYDSYDLGDILVICEAHEEIFKEEKK